MATLPALFISRLKEIIPENYLDGVLKSFSSPKVISLRFNALKTSRDEGFKALKENQISFEVFPGMDRAVVLNSITQQQLNAWPPIQSGYFYQQSLSSMLAAYILNPKEGDHVLDLCAAPGSKTSLLADLMNNKGSITAVEHIKERMYKLKSVLNLLGVTNTKIILSDGRRFRPAHELFDKILVDAPCSSEGRFHINQPKSFAYWSARKIKEMRTKQKGLLLSALRLLKEEGELVYSTCTFSPEENEEVVDWALRKTNGEVSLKKIDIDSFERVVKYPSVKKWKEKEFAPSIDYCLRILPTREMDGFFIAKFIRNQGK